MNYTQKMNALAFEQWAEYDFLDDEKAIVALLNDESLFRSFGEGLVYLIKKKDSSVEETNILKYISNACAKRGVSEREIGSLNTLKSWFRNGPRPKKGEDARNSLFALAFALDFTVDETVELFHKVYLDRAFDFRNEKDIVYYYCLANGKSLGDAKRIIDSLEYQLDVYDATLHSAIIRANVESFADEKDLIDYIQTHRNNLSKSNLTAKKYFEKLLEKSKKYAIREAKLPGNEEFFLGAWRGEDTVSVNFMYSVITSTNPSTKKGTTTIFKNARFPKEIKNRFPEASSFSEKEPTYESLRKMLILLFSYVFWYRIQWKGREYDIEDYTAQLDALLHECGYSPMYYGNPYDWLFLYCTLSENPLDAFRNILQESLEEQEVEEIEED